MARQLLLYPQDKLEHSRWWLREGGQLLQSGQGNLLQALKQAGRRVRVRLLLPPANTALYSVEAVSSKASQMQKAAPWALEDRLLQPVEQLAIQAAPSPSGKHWPVAVTDRETLQHWQQRLEHWNGAQGKLQTVDILPAVAALPGTRQQPVLWLTGGWLVWQADEQAWVVPADQWKQLLSSQGPEPRQSEVLHLWQEEAQQLPSDWDAHHPLWQGTPLELHSGSPFEQPPALAHEKQPHWQWLPEAARRVPSLRWSVALLLLLLVSWMGRDYWQLFQWNRQADALGQRMEQIYRQTFPDAGRIVDAQAQMRQRLDALRRAAGEQVDGSLLGLLQQIGPALAQPGLSLTSLRYRQGGLELDVRAANLSRLDALRQQMETITGQPVRMTVSTEAGEGATAQFRLQAGVQP